MLVTKTQDDSDKHGLGKKIEGIWAIELVKTTDCNTKITEIKNEIRSITGLFNNGLLLQICKD